MDTVIVEDLAVFCIIGLFPQERELPQNVLISMLLSIPRITHSDDLEASVDYSHVCSFVEQYLQEEKFLTLEKACQSIIQELFRKWSRLQMVEVNIRKPDALLKARSVGVHMKRERAHFHLS